MKYKLIIADFDGTLGNVPDIIHPDTVKTIKEYQNKGGIFSIVTGRSFSSISSICEKYQLNCTVSACQGSYIADLSKNKKLFSGGIDTKNAYTLINECLELGYPVVAWANDSLYFREESYYSNLYTNKLEQANYLQTTDVAKKILEDGNPVGKVCIIVPEEKTDEITNYLFEKYKGKYIVNSGAKRLIEVIRPDLNKGTAVRKIAEYYNIPLTEVLTVGDSTNDLQLIDGEWHGVAVGDADEQLKKVAKEITVPYSQNPVKVLIEKYL